LTFRRCALRRLLTQRTAPEGNQALRAERVTTCLDLLGGQRQFWTPPPVTAWWVAFVATAVVEGPADPRDAQDHGIHPTLTLITRYG
jgi:hypothetical protein